MRIIRRFPHISDDIKKAFLLLKAFRLASNVLDVNLTNMRKSPKPGTGTDIVFWGGAWRSWHAKILVWSTYGSSSIARDPVAWHGRKSALHTLTLHPDIKSLTLISGPERSRPPGIGADLESPPEVGGGEGGANQL